MKIQRLQSSIPNYGANYDDLPPVPITSARLGSTAPTLVTFIGNIEQYTFDATNDYVIGATEITHSYKEGTDLTCHIHWATNGTDGTNRGVKWQIEYSVQNGNSAFSGSTQISSEETIPAGTTDRMHYITGLGTISGTNLLIGAYILWRLNRIAAVGTAPSANPFALAVGFHFQQNSLGSRQIFIK